MMGMERNGQVVRMAAYAPLLVNEHDHWYWTNLIAFNQTRHAALPCVHCSISCWSTSTTGWATRQPWIGAHEQTPWCTARCTVGSRLDAQALSEARCT